MEYQTAFYMKLYIRTKFDIKCRLNIGYLLYIFYTYALPDFS